MEKECSPFLHPHTYTSGSGGRTLYDSIYCITFTHCMPCVSAGKGRLDMRIVLLGKTGSGKSSTGNTILGREAFRAEASPVSVTTQCEKHNVVIGQNIITVIDTPGILGTLLQPEEVMVKTAECINTTPHIFLLVIRLEEFTDEDRKSVQWIQEHFGEEALKYTIVLFTGVDQLEGKSVQMFIQGSSHLLQVINSCGDRYHVFNNKDKNDNTQVSELLEKIDELLNGYRDQQKQYDNEEKQNRKKTDNTEHNKRQYKNTIQKYNTKMYKKKMYKKKMVKIIAVTGGLCPFSVAVVVPTIVTGSQQSQLSRIAPDMYVVSGFMDLMVYTLQRQ
uniref:GTPase IMAP family member 8 n=1 Tax=Oncorhynchus mykiss TaxID=8022 RepID=A0A8C7TQJ3_ONCMY